MKDIRHGHPACAPAFACFTLSFRDVEELLAGRGITVSHETLRQWVIHFGAAIARKR